MKKLRNNLEYRIVTSKHLAAFKDSQAFIFDQLINGKYKFSSTSRELILLLYEQWFKLLLHIEQKLVTCNVVNQSIIDEFIIKVDNRYKEIKSISLDDSYFDQHLVSNWFLIHKASFELFRDNLPSVTNKNNKCAFAEISTNTIKYLNYSLFELHEIDALLYSKHEPFLCVDELNYFNKQNGCPELVINRLKLYKSLNYKLDKIKIKNYCNRSIPNNLIENLKQENVEVTIIE